MADAVELLLDEDLERPRDPDVRPEAPVEVEPGELLALGAADADAVRERIAALDGFDVTAIDDAGGGWRRIAFAQPETVEDGAALETLLKEINTTPERPRARVNRIVGCPRLMGGDAPDPPDIVDPPDDLPLGKGAGANVRVAVLDTAPLHHPSLKGHIDPMPDGPHTDTNGRVAGIAEGHSMLVAGIILRHAPAASVTIARVLDANGRGNDARLSRALTSLEPDVKLVNLSLGARARRLPAIETALRELLDRGVGIVASAGNDGTRRRMLPAAMPGVVGVTAIVGRDDKLRLVSWSQRGSWVRAAARGVHRYGPFVFGRRVDGRVDEAEFKGWCAWNGTSFAAPVVTGAAAALLGGNPGLTGVQALEQLLGSSPEMTLEEAEPGDKTHVRIVDPEPVWPSTDPGDQ